ncbi:hypothetical protein AB0I53_09880 [Saccharopolyspora sp. NPDC050389]|uniref:hypothetical protein n=1 Tax=Saccharopolyspora sp. NPDC050389 TaxID=3155516 RepID=UPI0033C67DD5
MASGCAVLTAFASGTQSAREGLPVGDLLRRQPLDAGLLSSVGLGGAVLAEGVDERDRGVHMRLGDPPVRPVPVGEQPFGLGAVVDHRVTAARLSAIRSRAAAW